MKNVYVMLSASARVETTTIRIKDVAQIICDSEEETKRINSLQIDEFCIKDNHKTFRKVIFHRMHPPYIRISLKA